MAQIVGQAIRSDNTVTLACRIAVEDAARFQRSAEERGVTVNELLGDLIRDLVNRSEER